MYSLLPTRHERAYLPRHRRQRPTWPAARLGLLAGAAVLLATGPLAACRDHDPPPAEEATASPSTEPTGLDGKALDPLASPDSPFSVLVFVSTECPISNRYAPTLREIEADYRPRGVAFYLVYPDPADDVPAIRAHVREFELPGTPVRDAAHQLVAAARARVTPEVAVFRAQGKRQELVYHGRIDDRARDFGKVRPEASQRDLVDSLDALLAGRSVPTPETKAVGCYIVDLD